MEIEPVGCIRMFVCPMNFGAGRKGNKSICWIGRPNLCKIGLFLSYFVYKLCFREISIIIMAICGQNKQFWVIFKENKKQ